MSRKTFGILGAVASLALSGILAGCGAGSEVMASGEHPEWGDLTITIADNGGDGSEELSKASGVFDDADYKVKFARFDFGPPLVAAAQTGDIDLGYVGNVPPITGAAKDLDFRVVGTTRSLNPDQASENIIVPKDSPIKTLADLKGKKLAIPQGSSAHGLALSAIQSVGLTTDDVQFVFLDPAAGQTAFSTGKVDAWSIWNPQSALAVEAGARVIAAGLPPIDQTSAYYVASKKSLDDPTRRAAVTDAFKRLAKAFAWGNAHTDDFAKAISKETGISLDDAKSTLPSFQRRTQPVLDSDIEAQQKLADNFYNAGEITTKVDFKQIVDNLLPADYNVG
ncbi:aliphatic sulfonate ABC transporter substrate-binding protein [Nocardioides sp. Kera G14]|uniref:aliphatic sulfonate ABC transporter substrate-binding protein n=1 Tax=Nocardioides sp. Kera G14 TaxID=2884264 RepID=UPI001D121F56|nr:aliphatic sulfonate ABC transporter substrate-binding protein [Nocardioides sp. Kera G14]UDY23053.1 aliphatic sulfonate ABC transporter substrate-binding protein [Nocardioides sp. Kera G14]